MIFSNYKIFGKIVPWESKEVVKNMPLAARYYTIYCSPSMFHLASWKIFTAYDAAHIEQ